MHIFDFELLVTNVGTLSMIKDTQGKETVLIDCVIGSGTSRFEILSISILL